MARRHEIPTHLNVEDRAILGLTVRQLTVLTVGLSSGYALWSGWPELATGARAGLALACVLVGAALALVRPRGRGLEEWAFVALHYLATPKASTWRPREPDPAAWRPARAAWIIPPINRAARPIARPNRALIIAELPLSIWRGLPAADMYMKAPHIRKKAATVTPTPTPTFNKLVKRLLICCTREPP